MSVHRVTELIGTSTQSGENAAAVAVRQAEQTLRDLRVAEVVAQDLSIGSDGSIVYHAKLQVPFSTKPTRLPRRTDTPGW